MQYVLHILKTVNSDANYIFVWMAPRLAQLELFWCTDMIQPPSSSISSTTNMFLLTFCLCLGNVNGIIPETSKTEMDIITNMETNMFREQMRQNDIFKEVEEVMEDTQQKLEDAVHQVFWFLYNPLKPCCSELLF